MIAADARCALHPDTPASGTCARCGTFICPADTSVVDLVAYCGKCAVRPDVDWLEAYRQSKVRKRSSTEWMMLLLVPIQLFYSVLCALGLNASAGELGIFAAVTALLLGSAVNGVLWFCRVRLARRLHLMLGAGWMLMLVVALAPNAGLAALLPAAIVGLLAAAPLTSVPSKLFFELPVERSTLLKTYHAIENNPAARYAVAVGVIGLAVPVFPLLAIVCGAIAWRRVDLAAKPPVGKRGQAIAGVALGVLGLLSSSLLWSQLRSFRG